MRSISFFGAAGDVTGSSYLVTTADDAQLLVDFGMFQGDRITVKKNYAPLPFKASQLKGVLLTHAHLDHCGRLPLLVYGGYTGKIYMTEPTEALVSVILNDAAKVAEQNMELAPLYGIDEVEKVLSQIEVVPYDREVMIGNCTAVFRDAGHILGSASVEILDRNDKTRIVFSGDLGNTPQDIVKPTQYIDSADFVVMESTYGDSEHPKEDPSKILQEEINLVERTSGVLMIPAFSVERTQELLHRIYHLKKDGLIRSHTPVFLDSPMGIHTTTIFKEFKTYYNEEIQSHTDDPFMFEGLVVTEEARDSKDILKAMNPKVIIAGSGMLSGGRILHHAKNYLSLPNSRLLFVGFQAEDTLGRKILEGAPSALIDEKRIKVKAGIREIKSLSSHADQPKLLTWLNHIKGVKKVFLTHGEEQTREHLSQKLQGSYKVILPEESQTYDLTSDTV